MKLVIKDLVKTYPNGVKALAGVSLEISQGMFGLLGPDGAGKSSLVRILATLQAPDSGELLLGNIDMIREPGSLKRWLGYLPQEFGVCPGVSAERLLHHFALLKGVYPVRERREIVSYLLHKVGLYDMRKQEAATYSAGMRQRLGIAQTLIGNPELVIVDEPAAGLDPGERRRVNNLLSEMAENRIVMLSTHLVEDVSDLCRDMAVIRNGTIVLSGTPAQLINQVSGNIWGRMTTRAELPVLQQQYPVLYSCLSGGRTYTRIYSENEPGDGFEQVPPRLEDLYFKSLLRG